MSHFRFVSSCVLLLLVAVGTAKATTMANADYLQAAFDCALAVDKMFPGALCDQSAAGAATHDKALAITVDSCTAKQQPRESTLTYYKSKETMKALATYRLCDQSGKVAGLPLLPSNLSDACTAVVGDKAKLKEDMQKPGYFEGDFGATDGYTLAQVKPLGEGVTGIVYKVQKGTEQFALKISRCGEMNSEIAALEALRGEKEKEFVLQMHAYGRSRDQLWDYYVMDLVGKDYTQLLYDGKVSATELRNVIVWAYQNIANLHSRGFTHGDMHLGNIAQHATEPGRVLFIDLGLSSKVTAEYAVTTFMDYNRLSQPLRNYATDDGGDAFFYPGGNSGEPRKSKRLASFTVEQRDTIEAIIEAAATELLNQPAPPGQPWVILRTLASMRLLLGDKVEAKLQAWFGNDEQNEATTAVASPNPDTTAATLPEVLSTVASAAAPAASTSASTNSTGEDHSSVHSSSARHHSALGAASLLLGVLTNLLVN